MIPGNRMPFDGLNRKDDRRALIAYSLVLGQEAAFRALGIQEFSSRRRRELAVEVASMLASQLDR